ncbi:glycosyltransferase family 2 protein [Bordetella bronchialis]|uniref:glycosyltransferase family 2 protein n=1 Tax=Bordetella bronchialis TaxID=463025 RepID=UPI000ACF887D|nr:glycosyltransferase [Bordetella bronchialis]
MTTAAPRVSIVVLTYNRRQEVLGNLARLHRDHPGVPIIVVDNGSADGTAEAVAAAFPALTLIRAPGNLGAAGRNLGVAAAATPYVAFCDDDTCWESGALEQAERLLDAAPRAGVINACVLVGPTGRVDSTCDIMARSPLGPGPAGTMRLLGFMAGACVMRRAAFLQAGGYEPRFFIGGEETVLALDLATLGWEMLYAGRVRTWHLPSPQRDRPRRVHLLSRNAIWAAWLRLPARSAIAETLSVLGTAARRGAATRVALSALAGAAWVARHRRRIPDHVEHWRQLVAIGPAPGAATQPSATPGDVSSP